MIPFIRKYVFGNAEKNIITPYVFLALLAYAVGAKVYYLVLFDISVFYIRLVVNSVLVLGYLALERSPLRREYLAFFTPVLITAVSTFYAVIFVGDYLIFTFVIAGSMISLTYMKPTVLAYYIAFVSVVHGVLIFVLGINIMGYRFTMPQNYAVFITTLGLNLMIYFFCKSYTNASHAKEIFLLGMSHEIRNPIQEVMGISEMEMQNHKTSPETSESLSRIYSSSRRLLGLIDDMLDFSRLEDGKMTLLNENYETATLIGNVAHPNYEDIGGKELEFYLHVDENLPVILKGDSHRVGQIMINLLSNAFKYTQRGYVDLSLKCRPHSEGQIMFIFSVQDTGLGMAQKQLDAIYNDFTRFYEHTNTSVRGTGMGLSIVYMLAKLMGGFVEMESVVGEGTMVTVHIPQEAAVSDVLGRDAADRLQQFKMTEPKRRFTSKLMPHASVLLVDDIETNLYVTRGMLDVYGLKIETCSSGQEAIYKIRQGKTYDLLLVDFSMPGMDGTETMKSIRKIGYTRPIVVVAAKITTENKEKLIKTGFDDVLSKPIAVKDLDGILMKHIRDNMKKET